MKTYSIGTHCNISLSKSSTTKFDLERKGSWKSKRCNILKRTYSHFGTGKHPWNHFPTITETVRLVNSHLFGASTRKNTLLSPPVASPRSCPPSEKWLCSVRITRKHKSIAHPQYAVYFPGLLYKWIWKGSWQFSPPPVRHSCSGLVANPSESFHPSVTKENNRNLLAFFRKTCDCTTIFAMLRLIAQQVKV